jgi:TatD DNase family protein
MDLHIGITGRICDERRGTCLRELARRVPLERRTLATDAVCIRARALNRGTRPVS